MATNPPGDTPPTGSSPQPGGGGGFDLGQAFSWSWNQFGKNAQVLLVIGAIIFGIQFAIRILGWIFGAGFSVAPSFDSASGSIFDIFLGTVVGFLLPLAGWLLTTLVMLGLVRVTLELTRGNKISVAEAFKTTSWGSYIIATILYGLSLFVGLLACCIGILVPLVMFAFYGYFVVDKHDGPGRSLSDSWKLVSSHFGQVIVVLLCVLGLNIVGNFTCGVASIFTVPFAALLLAYAYRTLRGEAVAATA